MIDDSLNSHVFLVIYSLFVLQAHMSLKNDRDLTVRSLFRKHNLGSQPSGPFSDEVASDLADRIQSKLKDLENDLQEKKVLFSLCDSVIVTCALIACNGIMLLGTRTLFLEYDVIDLLLVKVFSAFATSFKIESSMWFKCKVNIFEPALERFTVNWVRKEIRRRW